MTEIESYTDSETGFRWLLREGLEYRGRKWGSYSIQSGGLKTKEVTSKMLQVLRPSMIQEQWRIKTNDATKRYPLLLCWEKESSDNESARYFIDDRTGYISWLDFSSSSINSNDCQSNSKRENWVLNETPFSSTTSRPRWTRSISASSTRENIIPH